MCAFGATRIAKSDRSPALLAAVATSVGASMAAAEKTASTWALPGGIRAEIKVRSPVFAAMLRQASRYWLRAGTPSQWV